MGADDLYPSRKGGEILNFNSLVVHGTGTIILNFNPYDKD